MVFEHWFSDQMNILACYLFLPFLDCNLPGLCITIIKIYYSCITMTMKIYIETLSNDYIVDVDIPFMYYYI